jgi:acyl-CoA thioester hydrolase
MKEIITRIIPFCDVDATGVMWHGSYVRYFEEARCRLFEKCGFSYETILANGYQLPVISLKIKYVKPCGYNQKINITAKLEKSEHIMIVVHEIADAETSEKMSEAETRHIAFCSETKRSLLRLPDFILDKMFAE